MRRGREEKGKRRGEEEKKGGRREAYFSEKESKLE